MRLLLTGAGSMLGHKLVAALDAAHDVQTTDDTPELGVQAVADLRDPAVVPPLVADRDAIVHLGPLGAANGLTAGDALDRATRETYNLMLAAVKAGVRRFVLLSTMRLFDRYPPRLSAIEGYRPRPTTDPADLAPYLAEVVAREVTRVSPLTTVCQRLGEVVDDAEAARRPFDPRWVHFDDVVHALDRALQVEPDAPWPGNSFDVYHVVAPGPRSRYSLGVARREPFGYAPRHDFARWESTRRAEAVEPVASPPPLPPTRPPRRVVVYGAAGPLAAVTSELLAPNRMLRLTDIRPLAEVQAAGVPQSPGAPIARPYGPPHEEAQVAVGDETQVVAAAAGMDAILNCTVVRPELIGAFRVNLVGAYHVCRAALANGIRRVVHTGPQQTTAGAHGFPGYAHDFGVVDDVPARPGASLYILTKYLGQEVCRIFAEDHGLEIPALLFTSFINPDYPLERPQGLYPMAVSWPDAARAIERALDVPLRPGLELFHVSTDLPHGKYSNDKAKRLLGWQPRDRLERQWGPGSVD